MPSFSYGFSPGQSSSGTVTIPKRALNVTVTIAGAKGGTGGYDSGGPGGSGANGRAGTFILPYREASHTLSVYLGQTGANGAGGPPGGKSRAAGGSGGTSTLNGGRGGRDSLGGGWSGVGAGGGGASYMTDSAANGTIIVAAGGGGGGGGSWERTGQSAAAPYDWTGWTSGQGAMSLSFAAGGDGANNPYDGGGGGGGGGGMAPTSDGGQYGTDKSQGGRAGEPGISAILAGFVDTIEATFQNDGYGYASISYDNPDWIPNAFTIGNVTGANPSSYVTVASGVSISGINIPIDIFAVTSGLQVRKTGTTSWGTKVTGIEDGESFDVRFQTPNTGGPGDLGYSVTTQCQVCAGLDAEPNDKVCASFSVTTRDPDIEPNPFEWTASEENTPFAYENIQSDTITLGGFEIPLAIKSNYPIQVMINGDGVWRDVQQI